MGSSSDNGRITSTGTLEGYVLVEVEEHFGHDSRLRHTSIYYVVFPLPLGLIKMNTLNHLHELYEGSGYCHMHVALSVLTQVSNCSGASRTTPVGFLDMAAGLLPIKYQINKLMARTGL